MSKFTSFHFNPRAIFEKFLIASTLLLVLFTASCSAQQTQTEEQALQSLRQMTKDGKLPPETFVQQIETRFAKTRTGALAKLLHARIRFEASDFAGAAQILNSDVFRRTTSVADYALWLRGRALQNAGNHQEAMRVFGELIKDFPNSLRARDAKLLWANSALQSGQAAQIQSFLSDLIEKNDADAFLLAAKSFEAEGNQAEAVNFYRKVHFYGAGTDAAKEAEAKLTSLGQPLTPQTADEARVRAEKFYAARKYAEAQKAFADLSLNFPTFAFTPEINLKRTITFSNTRQMSEAQSAFNLIPVSAKEKEEAFYNLALGYARSKQWAQARTTVEDMRRNFPNGNLTPKALMDIGMMARDAKNKADESFFLQTAVLSYPNATAVAAAQFELAWLEHDGKNFAKSSQMFVEHLARYADKDTTNRGKAGYWAARDAERASQLAESCALYDAVIYRYGANWYGYLATQRIASLRAQGKCQATQNFTSASLVPKAIANLKKITVAAETATAKELERAEKSEQLSTVGLFDWSVSELEEARKTAPNSPKINLALAEHYRMKGEQVNALNALKVSYPDYAQMFPEEMGREEWDIFYPLTNWSDIKYWAQQRSLDPYQVAGIIRQETIFDARAKSNANAYGLMQLLIPTARAIAKKYNSSTTSIFGETLFQPALNIELGTAYMRDQFDKFGRFEYVAVAYNAGPGRVPQWRASLPFEMDEFVEEIPFKETKGYVQGVIRNSAQYRRLYDENGNFKPNVGTRALRGEIDAKPREQFAEEFPEVVLDENPTGE
ncbi:MAG TPA: transglycosylase SLT domain-containing protein [Pyrinomonadaceae bacterium]|jgi:soluble lytic murein transglycosylase